MSEENESVKTGNSLGYRTSKQSQKYFPEYPAGGKHSPGASNTRHYLADHGCRWIRFGTGNISGKQMWLESDVIKIAGKKHAKKTPAAVPVKQIEMKLIKSDDNTRIDRLEKMFSELKATIIKK